MHNCGSSLFLSSTITIPPSLPSCLTSSFSNLFVYNIHARTSRGNLFHYESIISHRVLNCATEEPNTAMPYMAAQEGHLYHITSDVRKNLTVFLAYRMPSPLQIHYLLLTQCHLTLCRDVHTKLHKIVKEMFNITHVSTQKLKVEQWKWSINMISTIPCPPTGCAMDALQHNRSTGPISASIKAGDEYPMLAPLLGHPHCQDCLRQMCALIEASCFLPQQLAVSFNDMVQSQHHVHQLWQERLEEHHR